MGFLGKPPGVKGLRMWPNFSKDEHFGHECGQSIQCKLETIKKSTKEGFLVLG